MSNYIFSLTDQDLQDIDDQARQRVKEYKDKAPVFEDRPANPYLQEGSHLVRIYPDRGENGKARYFKPIFMHTRGLPVSKDRKAWIWADDRVDAILQEFEKAGMKKIFGDDLWKFKSQEVAIGCVHFFESSDADNHPAGSTVILTINAKQHAEFNSWLMTLRPEEKRPILNPLEDAPGIRLGIVKGSKSNVSVGIDGLGRTLVQLPLPPRLWDSVWKKQLEQANGDKSAIKTHAFTSLDKVGRRETDVLTDEQFSVFQEMAYREFEEWRIRNQGTVRDSAVGKGIRPNEGGLTRGNGANQTLPGGRKSEKLLRELPGTGERTCPLLELIQRKPDLVDTYGHDVKYGNKPFNNPKCMICTHNSDCEKQTERNLAAVQEVVKQPDTLPA